LVKLDSNIAVLWLYGSRAKSTKLQLLTEACIGIAKQSVENIGKEVPADARKTFSKLRMLGLEPTGTDWNRIIGMRNALVHDNICAV
jgi:uncharacterized protein YutE (UPF0331/DUF86 family)